MSTVTWTSGSSLGSVLSLPMSPDSIVTIGLNAEGFTLGQVNFEVSTDNVNWFPLLIDSAGAENIQAAQATLSGPSAWEQEITGWGWVRVVLSTQITDTDPLNPGSVVVVLQVVAVNTNAVSPLTTLGDLLVFGSSGLTRLPVGTNGEVLTADSAQTDGIAWEAFPPPNQQPTSLGSHNIAPGASYGPTAGGGLITIPTPGIWTVKASITAAAVSSIPTGGNVQVILSSGDGSTEYDIAILPASITAVFPGPKVTLKIAVDLSLVATDTLALNYFNGADQAEEFAGGALDFFTATKML